MLLLLRALEQAPVLWQQLAQEQALQQPAGRAGRPRPQWLEALLQIAAKKYGVPRGSAPLGALPRLLHEHVLPLLGPQDEPEEDIDALEPMAPSLSAWLLAEVAGLGCWRRLLAAWRPGCSSS